MGPARRTYEFGMRDRLRAAREEAGFGQREFAEAAGIGRVTVSNYEAGRGREVGSQWTAAPDPRRLGIRDGIRPHMAGDRKSPRPARWARRGRCVRRQGLEPRTR